jgi:hypothetical protein
MTTPYTEGSPDQAWEVEQDDRCCWVQRKGWNQRNTNVLGQELIFCVDQVEQAQALADRLNELDRLRKQPQILRDQVMDILQRANAGWLNDYKIEISGASYIQWGKVEQDIRALFDAPNVKAVLVQQLQTWRRVGRFILDQWNTHGETPHPAMVRLLAKRTQAAMDGTTEEGSL